MVRRHPGDNGDPPSVTTRRIRNDRRLRWAAPVAVVVLDYLANRRERSLVAAMLIDEAAHLLTTLLMLSHTEIWPAAYVSRRSALAASVLIDIDHIPDRIFGSQ